MTKPIGRFRRRLVSGIAVVVPLFITVFILRALFRFVAGILLSILGPAMDHWPTGARIALAAGILILGVYALGELAAHVLGRRVISLGEAVLMRVPLVRSIYKASRQVVSSFGGTDRPSFRSVALIDFPHPGAKSVGFVTSTFEKPDGSSWNTVFIPTTPNPTTGFLQVLPASSVVQTDFTIEEALQMVMSSGVLSPPRLKDVF